MNARKITALHKRATQAYSGLHTPYYAELATGLSVLFRDIQLARSFSSGLPIMQLPSIQEVSRVSLGKSGVSKHEFGSLALFRGIKPNKGENSGIPVGYAQA